MAAQRVADPALHPKLRAGRDRHRVDGVHDPEAAQVSRRVRIELATQNDLDPDAVLVTEMTAAGDEPAGGGVDRDGTPQRLRDLVNQVLDADVLASLVGRPIVNRCAHAADR